MAEWRDQDKVAAFLAQEREREHRAHERCGVHRPTLGYRNGLQRWACERCGKRFTRDQAIGYIAASEDHDRRLHHRSAL